MGEITRKLPTFSSKNPFSGQDLWLLGNFGRRFRRFRRRLLGRLVRLELLGLVVRRRRVWPGREEMRQTRGVKPLLGVQRILVRGAKRQWSRNSG